MDCDKCSSPQALKVPTWPGSKRRTLSSYLRRYESAILHGQAALREALQLRQDGFEPDLIIGHSGFGNTLYLKSLAQGQIYWLFPEWFYRSQGADVGFGSDQPPSRHKLACSHL